MRFSYSKVDCFKNCPMKYKYRYIDGLKTIPDQNSDNALYLGSGIHKGIETTVKEGVAEYQNHFYVLTDEIINWSLQLEYWVPKVKELLPENGQHELEIKTEDYIGFIDYVVTDTIYDFKFTTEKNQSNYLKSSQLSIYKYYYEQTNPKIHINHLKYIFIPKVAIRQKKSETIHQFRERLYESMDKLKIQVVEVPYDLESITHFRNKCNEIETTTEYPKKYNQLCGRFCEYYRYCMFNEDWMIL